MTVRGVRVRAAVDRAARIRRRLLVAAARQQAEDGRDYAQHQNEAGYANTDGEALLRDANAVLRALENKSHQFKHRQQKETSESVWVATLECHR